MSFYRTNDVQRAFFYENPSPKLLGLTVRKLEPSLKKYKSKFRTILMLGTAETPILSSEEQNFNFHPPPLKTLFVILTEQLTAEKIVETQSIL